MIKPTCDKCRKELTDFGGLAFSPPNKYGAANNVSKHHLCVDCWEAFRVWLKEPTTEVKA